MRRNESQEIVEQLLTTIGPRLATSLAEARAAAFVDGCLRRIGMKVTANAFRTNNTAALAYVLLNLIGLSAALIAPFFPGPALLVASVGLWLNVNSALLATLPLPGPRRESQHVIGNRASEKATYRRVVLLAPLDTHPGSQLLWQLTGSRRPAQLIRATAFSLIALIALAALVAPNAIWLYVKFAPAAVCFSTLIAELLLASGQTPQTAGANEAGALATMIAAAGQLNELKTVQLWAVGIGASNRSGVPFSEFLLHYPFDTDTTLFIAIEGIKRGQLAYASRIGTLRPQPADARLLHLAATGDAADPLIDAEPLTNINPPLAEPLMRRGYRVLTILSRNDHPTQPDNGVDIQLVERATRLIVAIVNRIDQGAD